jgi:hypothetical protein
MHVFGICRTQKVIAARRLQPIDLDNDREILSFIFNGRVPFSSAHRLAKFCLEFIYCSWQANGGGSGGGGCTAGGWALSARPNISSPSPSCKISENLGKRRLASWLDGLSFSIPL